MSVAILRLYLLLMALAATGCVSTMDGPRVTYFKPGDASSYISCIEEEDKQIERTKDISFSFNGRPATVFKSEFTADEVWSRDFQRELNNRCFRKICQKGGQSCREDGNRMADSAPVRDDKLTTFFDHKPDPKADGGACNTGDVHACFRAYGNLSAADRAGKTGFALKKRICSSRDARCFDDSKNISEDDRTRLTRDGFTEVSSSSWMESGVRQSLTVYFRAKK